MKFHCIPFKDLSLNELYRILQLRSEVFVVEQNCVYLDMDDLDQEAHHVMGIYKGNIHAHTRILRPDSAYENYSAIGRVITSSDVRQKGFGRRLMQFSIDQCLSLYPDYDIMIGAQTYLLHFYSSLGFERIGDEYLEDGIPHYHMIYYR